jgi:1,4-alpha-glucan branching enzyme
MLAQASDWEFLVSTHSAEDYAKMRFHQHREDFFELISLARKLLEGKQLTKAQEVFVRACEARNAIFPELQIEWWTEEYPS